MAPANAERPTAENGKHYHLETGPNDLAARCVLVGDPGRATRIANLLLGDVRKVGDHRGLVSYTGKDENHMPISIVTTGMGGASIGIVLPEAVASGAKAFIRVGSCGALKEEARVGDLAIATGAVRLDGASVNWAPIEWPAIPDWQVVMALTGAAEYRSARCHHGIGITTDCFYEGQARPDQNGYVPERLLRRHDELVRRGALFYAMEEAALFVWCSTHGGIPCGAVNTIYANRVTGEFRACDDTVAAKVALYALRTLSLP